MEDTQFLPPNPRDIALRYIWSYIGNWYKWGGDDPSGFDCSGIIIETLKSVGWLPRKYDTTAHGLYIKYRKFKVQDPYAGCLVFWHSPALNKMVHVEMVVNDRLSIGASGGGSRTLTIKDAIRDNAFIKMREMASRANLYGFVDPFREKIW